MGDWPAGGLGRMYRLIGEMPGQFAASSELPGLAGIRPLATANRRVVLCGMGGSAIGGDLVQPLLAASRESLTVWRDYGLPHWVTADDLVICCSYSGDTEEALSGAAAAGDLGCPRIAISSGGQLGRLATAASFPLVTLPGKLPPRASLGYGFGALLRVLDRLGIIHDAGAAITSAAATLRRHDLSRREPMAAGAVVHEDSEGNLGPAALAEMLVGRTAVIYTCGTEVHGVGFRWKAQLNENSKVPAMVAPFPELDHNDLVGWSLSREQRDRFVLLLLRGADDSERMAQRVEITCNLLRDEFAGIHEIRSGAETPLERVLSLVQYGDYLSCHLARLRGVDPVPVTRIDKLKNALS